LRETVDNKFPVKNNFHIFLLYIPMIGKRRGFIYMHIIYRRFFDEEEEEEEYRDAVL